MSSLLPSAAETGAAAALFQGKTIVVTGASDGIGRASVNAFASGGATVVMVGRNEAKTAAAARSIMAATGSRDISWEIADLSRQAAVHELAERLQQRCAKIDVLLNNAGACFMERGETAEGLEQTFALNHLAYFTLTLLLLDRLSAAATAASPARVLNVSSRAHRDARLDINDLQCTQGYRGWRAYGNSKLANILFTRALAARLDAKRVVVHALHPGVVSTRFATNNGRRGRLARRIMDVVSVSPQEGADTMVWMAHASEVTESSGAYWVKRKRLDPSDSALDSALADALWRKSGDLAHLDPDALVRASGLATLPR